MSEKITVLTLKKSKKEAQSTLHCLEIEIGHYLLKKPEKSIQKDVLKTYKSFDQDIDAFRATQENINALAEERKNLQMQMTELKSLMSSVKGQLPDVYKLLGESLFSNYTAAYSDFFGSIYTQTAVQDQKIAAEHKKEDAIRDDMDKASFIPRILKHVQAGAAKTQATFDEQKRDSSLIKGAKAAIESGKLVKLSQEKQLDENSENVLNEYLDLQKTLTTHQASFEALALNESGVVTSLAKNGTSGSPQKRIQSIEKEIGQKKVEQDEFSATQGHEYTCRYVSPDGETIVAFPADIVEVLSNIQTQKLLMMSFSRQIEILGIEKATEDGEKRIQSYSRTISVNNDKVTSLQHQNDELASKIKTAKSEQKVRNAKKEALEAEEKAAIKRSESDTAK